MKTDINAALKVYLGAGPRGGYQPVGKDERLRNTYLNDADATLKEIEKYLQLDHPPSKWSQPDLGIEQSVVERTLAQKFPELDKVSVNALACYWSFQWR